jgi:hypothetical protein
MFYTVLCIKITNIFNYKAACVMLLSSFFYNILWQQVALQKTSMPFIVINENIIFCEVFLLLLFL